MDFRHNSFGIHCMPGGIADDAAVCPMRIARALSCITEAMSDFVELALALEEHKHRPGRGAGGNRPDAAPSERRFQCPLHPVTAFEPVNSEPSSAWNCRMDRRYYGCVHPARPAACSGDARSAAPTE